MPAAMTSSSSTISTFVIRAERYGLLRPVTRRSPSRCPCRARRLPRCARHPPEGERRMRKAALLLASGLVALGTAVPAGAKAPQPNGSVTADGSSTVGPWTAAAAEGYRKVQPGVRVTVGISGTGGGFEQFCRGELDLANAS